MLKTKMITGAHRGPRLLIAGGVHGDRFDPLTAALGLMEAIRPETLCGMVTPIPIVNEAAHLPGALERETGIGAGKSLPRAGRERLPTGCADLEKSL